MPRVTIRPDSVRSFTFDRMRYERGEVYDVSDAVATRLLSDHGDRFMLAVIPPPDPHAEGRVRAEQLIEQLAAMGKPKLDQLFRLLKAVGPIDDVIGIDPPEDWDEDDEPPAPAGDQGEGEPALTMSQQLDRDHTIETLKALAEEHSIDLGDATRKGDIIAVVVGHFGGE